MSMSTSMTTAMPEFDEVWRWDGWTTESDQSNGGAIGSGGSVILVGSQGVVAEANEDFVAVKLSASGELLWT